MNVVEDEVQMGVVLVSVISRGVLAQVMGWDRRPSVVTLLIRSESITIH